MSCTTLLVGKNASYDGSTMIARNEDSGSGSFSSKDFIVVKPEEQPRKYKSVISKVEIDLPENPMRYTALPNGDNSEGIWACAGVNEKNVAMSATETLTSNERVLGADPLVRYIPACGKEGEKDFVPEKFGGIGEEDLVTITLPYINSAREGVIRLGELHEKYGTYEMNGIAFSDVDEIWWFETVGGHHWIARRVPDDCYVTMPNQLGLDEFDFEDAFSEQKEFMCSKDMREFIKENHLDLSLDGNFNPRDAFGSHSDSDHVYNTPRAWIMQKFFNPHSNIWDGDFADYKPSDDDIPWCRVPEKKITIEDAKYSLSSHYQGTIYDVYSKHNDNCLKGSLRPIGINRNNVLALIQIRPDKNESVKAIEWLAFGCNVFNAFVPFYTDINDTPKYLKNSGTIATTENFYWTNRIIAALCDPHFSENSSHIERYQLSVQSKARNLIKKYDEKISKLDYEKASEISEEANAEIAKMLKEETEKVLSAVLYESSCLMKNSFSKSDM